MWTIIGLIFILNFSNNVYDVSGSLLKALRHYERLHSKDLSHSIVKRGLHPSSNKFNTIKQLSFKALDRNFRLMLTPGTEVLSSHFQAYSVDGSGRKEPVYINHENFYEGRILGEKYSHASVHFEDGLLTATIHTNEDTYVIEPSWRHLPDEDNKSMIAYRGSDLRIGWDQEHHANERIKICGFVREGPNVTADEEEEEDDDNSEEPRVKRQAEKFDLSRTRCPLLLVADYHFYQSMGGRSKKSTINYLISLIDRVHKIYSETEWQDNNVERGFKGMGFVIEEIIVHNESTPVGRGQKHYNMEQTSWDVRDLLETFSREPKHSKFCLAHLFTDIKFEGGILGLAYVGSSRRNSVGGICTPEYYKNEYVLYLNSGLSSSRNHYGQRVITREADLVTAHEFGHSWGSEHDPDNAECSPDSSRGGSFLMYTYSVSGYDINNKRFSPCSLRSIRAVLMAKSSKCFKEPQESFCGNSRVENGEECDAGLLSTGPEDLCCERNCTLKPQAKCSDKNSPCCRDCNYLPPGYKCRDANPNTCKKEALCNGYSAECPPADPEEDDEPCIDKGKCLSGRCLPLCETKGMHSCMCDVVGQSCQRCCRTSLNSTCFPLVPRDFLSDGTPCIHGFCKEGHCEKTIQDIVERFWDIIEEININSLMKFLNDNIVGTVIVISIIIWLPASCIISYVDRRRRARERKQEEWFNRTNSALIHGKDTRSRIIRVPLRRATGRILTNTPVAVARGRPSTNLH